MNELAARIEAFLRARGCWVSAAELCGKFEITKRDLRGRDGEPGLCASFVVSGNRGFKHIAAASKDEEERSYRRARRNGINQLVMARRRRRAWRSYQAEVQPPAVAVERGSDQLLLLTP